MTDEHLIEARTANVTTGCWQCGGSGTLRMAGLDKAKEPPCPACRGKGAVVLPIDRAVGHILRDFARATPERQKTLLIEVNGMTGLLLERWKAIGHPPEEITADPGDAARAECPPTRPCPNCGGTDTCECEDPV